MKSKLFVFVAFILFSSILPSCTKYYECECVDYKGKKTITTISAKTSVDANKTCDEQGNLGECELK